jgi:L-malate glycosyltransferase
VSERILTDYNETMYPGMPDKQKIILHVFDQFRIGGTESRTCQIINCMGRKYHHVVCSQKNNFEAKRLLSKDTDVSFLLVRSDPKNIIGNIIRIRKTLREVGPALLVSYAWGTMEWAIANSFKKICPNIHALEGFGDDEVHRQKLRRNLTRMLFLPTCARVVTCSDFLMQLAVNSWRVPRNKILFIPNGVDISLFSKQKTETVISRMAKECVTLGIVATLSPLKNHLRLLRVLEQLSDEIIFKLIVAGDGQEMQRLKNYTNASHKLQGRVDFRGHCDEPWKVLEQVDILCLSSDTEQMPMSVLEGMAAGLPVISTDVGDVGKMLSYENKSFVVPKNNEHMYGEKLKELIINFKLQKTIGKANQKKCIREYSKHNMIQKYENLYANFMNHDYECK